MTIDRFGYVQVRMPEHPRAGKNGQVYEHIVVMEKFIGRYLHPGEVVHHKDSNRKNNKIENLQLFPSNSEHSKFHTVQRHIRLGIDKRIEQIRLFAGEKTVSEMAGIIGITRDQCWHTVHDYNLPFKKVKTCVSKEDRELRRLNTMVRKCFRCQKKYYTALAAIEKMDSSCAYVSLYKPYLIVKVKVWYLDFVAKKWGEFYHL